MTETKDTNPKDAVGTAKVPFSTIPAQVVAELGLAMMEGALKYGRHNYRAAGVRASVYYDAALRHLTSFWEGEDVDPDSGLPHIIKAIACFVVLRDSQIQGNWTDDRPPKTPGGWVKELNAKAGDLLLKYPNPVPAHTEIDHKPVAPITVDSLDHADTAYYWENAYLRFRWDGLPYGWSCCALAIPPHAGSGWIKSPGNNTPPFTRANKVLPA